MNSGSNNNNEKGVEVRTQDIPVADAMSEFMKQGWILLSCTLNAFSMQQDKVQVVKAYKNLGLLK